MVPYIIAKIIAGKVVECLLINEKVKFAKQLQVNSGGRYGT